MDNLPVTDLVHPFSVAQTILGDSRVSKYILRYLAAKESKTIVIETNYTDKDYLIDFSKFYSRSFNINEKHTTRVHFFDHIFSNDEFLNILKTGDLEKIKTLNEHYLGFSVVKPIKDQNQDYLIGRTLLKTYEKHEGEYERKYLKSEQEALLFGINLKIESLPYQTQDSAVGGCATIACWTVLQHLSQKFEMEKASPYEVTEKSVHIPTIGRNFPSHGLTMEQMKSFFDETGLETEFILPHVIAENKFYDHQRDCFVEDAVKAYLELDIPVLIGIGLKANFERRTFTRKLIDRIRRKKIGINCSYHAVVVTGYKSLNKKIVELYLHDDGIGPYCKTFPVKNFSSWKNDWLDNRGFSAVYINTILVPLYPKIRLPFKEIYVEFLSQKRYFESLNLSKNIDPSIYCAELFLMDVRHYKQQLISESFNNKIEIMVRQFPRFLWVLRHNYCSKPYYDFILDATDVYATEPFQVIEYIR
jgi:hypothetical protein